MANLDPMGMVGRIYKGDYCYTQNIKALRLMVSEWRILCSSYYKSMGANDPRGVANLDPKGMIGRIYVRYH